MLELTLHRSGMVQWEERPEELTPEHVMTQSLAGTRQSQQLGKRVNRHMDYPIIYPLGSVFAC